MKKVLERTRRAEMIEELAQEETDITLSSGDVPATLILLFTESFKRMEDAELQRTYAEKFGGCA